MRWAPLLIVACSSTRIGGTLAYNADDLSVHVLDLASGEDTQIDPGQFGSVTISPDASHVTYAGIDQVTRVADRAGNITGLPGKGCAGTATWLSNSVVTWCSATGNMLLPSIGGSPRSIGSSGVALSADGASIAYVNTLGDVVIEAPDGSGSRVLVPSPSPTSAALAVAGFTPDQQALLVFDFTGVIALRIVSVASGTSIDVPGVHTPSSLSGTTRFIGASPFSPDGSELLLTSATALVAVSLRTGAQRTIAPFAGRQSATGAAFLDADHVVWVRVDDHTVGDEGLFSLSVHLTGPTPSDDVVLDAPPFMNTALPTIGVAEGFIALPGDALLVDLQGNVLVPNTDSEDILGITPDGAIASSLEGPVRLVTADGDNRVLVTTGHDSHNELLPPFAAYTPN